MKKKSVNLPLITLSLFCAVAFTILAIENFLIGKSNYNVYRVLDISALGIFLLLSIVAIQYLFFRNLPFRLNDLIQSPKSFKNQWFALLGVYFFCSVIFSLFLFKSPFWIPIVLLIALIGFSWLTIKWDKKPFQKVIFLLLFGAGLNASFIFWLHEENNEGTHIHYARQLAERRDSIAEHQLLDFAKLGKEQSVNSENQSFWEKEWLKNSYLSSNYRMDIRESEANAPTDYYKPILTFDENSTPVFQLFFPTGYSMYFPLKKDFRRSVYTDNIPYKNLERLNDYLFAVVDHGEIVLANSHEFDLNILNVKLPAIGKGEKIELNGFDVLAYHHADEVYVLIGEPLSEALVWFSNFAFFFVLFLVVAFLYKLVILFLLKKDNNRFWQKLPIEIRIQASLIALTVFLFFVIATTTFFFLHQNNLAISYERQQYISENIQKTFSEKKKLFNWNLSDITVKFLAKLADKKQCEIDVYNASGKLIVNSIATAEHSPAPKVLNRNIQEKIEQNPSAIIVTPFRKDGEPCLRSAFSIMKNKQLEGYVAINTFESEIGTAQDIPIIMSKLLNVYVCLLLIIWALGLFLINLLTKPLQLLANSLSQFKPGQQNEKLTWEGNDAIGQLIGEYNNMVDVVEQTTQELVRNEKEGAWQIMAQQISHEINNSLTPLQLNIQFLNRILKDPEALEVQRVERITAGIAEQIDNLARVAMQFKIFAKLENPEASPLDLTSFLELFFSDFKDREDNLYQLINELDHGTDATILIDEQHLQKVLKNIIANAEESIPENRKGCITLRLKQSSDKVVIEVEDNGHGIDDSLSKNIFDPQFSTKSSRTGLGLAICCRIVEFYKGDLSYSTQLSIGTSFQIAFPMALK